LHIVDRLSPSGQEVANFRMFEGFRCDWSIAGDWPDRHGITCSERSDEIFLLQKDKTSGSGLKVIAILSIVLEASERGPLKYSKVRLLRVYNVSSYCE
jgi:hypothetical protein